MRVVIDTPRILDSDDAAWATGVRTPARAATLVRRLALARSVTLDCAPASTALLDAASGAAVGTAAAARWEVVRRTVLGATVAPRRALMEVAMARVWRTTAHSVPPRREEA